MSSIIERTDIEVRPLAGFIGAEIFGVDLAAGVTDDQVRQIRQALNKWKVVFFREQFIDHAQHLAFARRFGKPTLAHPYDAHAPDSFPQIRTISSRTTTGRRGERWHIDLSGVVNPPAGSILRAGQLPPYGGDTVFTNLVAAYEGLSAPVRTLVDGLWARHQFGGKDSWSIGENSTYAQNVRANPSITDHPVVRVHPLTGERALFVNPTFTAKLLDVSPEESTHLLDLLFTEITRPEYTVRFRWAPGSVAFWDNRASAHAGPAPFEFDHLGVERIMYRITLEGEVPVGIDGSASRVVAGQAFKGLESD